MEANRTTSYRIQTPEPQTIWSNPTGFRLGKFIRLSFIAGQLMKLSVLVVFYL